MVLQLGSRNKLSAIVIEEPLSPTTEGKRRNLLFTSCFSILLVVYGLKVTRTPWLEIEVPEGAPNILHGALSVALFYTFIVFAPHAAADLRRWFMSGDLLNLHSYFDLSLSSRNHLHAIHQWLGKELPTEQNKRDSIEKMYSEAFAFFEDLEGKIATSRNSHAKLSLIQWVRLSVLDLGVPLGLGLFAMCKIGSSLPPFLSVVLG